MSLSVVWPYLTSLCYRIISPPDIIYWQLEKFIPVKTLDNIITDHKCTNKYIRYFKTQDTRRVFVKFPLTFPLKYIRVWSKNSVIIYDKASRVFDSCRVKDYHWARCIKLDWLTWIQDNVSALSDRLYNRKGRGVCVCGDFLWGGG